MVPSVSIVRRWRERQRLSVKDAATLLDVSAEQYENLEACHVDARTPGIGALQTTAGITLADIRRERKTL